MTDFKALLLRLNENLNILQEQAAKYGSNVPVELHNKIADHEQAIAFTEQAIQSEISEAAWREALKPLLVSLPDEAKLIVNATNIGIVGDNAHVEGGIHFNTSQIDQRDQTVQQQVNVVGNLIQQITPPPATCLPLQRPPRAAHFTNRKEELAKLLADLQPGKVVTLCGPGGIGKTALAAEAIWTLAPGNETPGLFPDGIIFHSFYNQPQAVLALEAIARAFGEEPKPTPRDAALRALAGKQALLLLDGTEEADDLRAVLDVRGGCGAIVTSRQRKDAVDERQDVTPLEPDEAVKLLRAWGKEQAADAEVATQICEMVGRLPLAVRLAGRYLDEMDEIAGKYLAWLRQTPLEALDQGQRRQESVPVLLQKSLAQVGAAACEVLGVVGQLALAPFGLDPIAAALDVSPDHLRKPLGELVSYGLLSRNGERYEVTHALIHTYARAKVMPGPEAMKRLAAYYTQLAETESAKGLAGYARLDGERTHLMRVLAGCVEREEWAAVESLARAIEDYLDIRGYSTERVMVNETGLNAARHSSNRRNEGDWLGNLGLAYRALGQVDKAIGYSDRALVIAREIGDRRGEGNRLGNLGLAYSDLGQVDKAIGYSEQALVIAREIGDRRGEGAHLGNLGNAYRALGQVDKAIGYYDRALVIAREIGDRRGEGAHLGNLGNAYRALGQVDKAIGYYDRALVIAREIGDRRGEGNRLGSLGIAYSDLGQVDKAIGYSEQALVIAREIGDRRGEGAHLGNLGNAYSDLGQVDKAIGYYDQALVISREIGDRRGEGADLGNLGATYRDLGQVDKAIGYYDQALVISREIGDRRGEGAHLGNLGLAYSDLGQVDKAIGYYDQALVIAREIGDRRGEGAVLGNLGIAYSALGQVDKAIGYYDQALVISREIGDRRGEGAHLGNLGLAYSDLGQVDKAIGYYDQALVIAREIGDRRGEGNHLGNLGNAYSDLGQVDKAIGYMKQALKIFEEIKSPAAEQARKILMGLENT